MKLPTLAASSFIIALSVFLVSCGDGDSSQEFVEAKGGKVYGGTYTLNVLRGDPNGLDPVLINSKHADDIASQVFDKLIDLNDKLEVVPELAIRLPEISEDGRVYTFHLRTNAKFHDNECFPDGKGRMMTAEDVKYSFTRACDPRTRTVAYWAFKNKVKGATEYFESVNAGEPLEGVEGFRVLNDSTFQIELIEPYAPFIYYLVNSLGSVVAREAVEKYGRDFFQNPVGTGPFVFDHWTPGQELLVTKNPDYWGSDSQKNTLPLLDAVRFEFVKDDKTQFNTFVSGGFDESYNIPTELFSEVFNPETLHPQPKYAEYQLQAVPAMLTWYFSFNNQRPPFDNKDVRKAFNYAIDREKIVRYILQESPYAPADHGLVPPVFGSYPVESIKGYSFDEEKAREHLANAGYPDGKGFPEITLYVYPEPRLTQVANGVQEMLTTTLNIPVSIQVMDFPQLIGQAEEGKLEFWGTRWYGDYPDPETYLNLLNGELVPAADTLPSYPNSARYNSPDFNRLFKQGVKTIDFTARMKYYADAEQIAMDDAPIMPLFYERHYRMLQPYVRDNPLDAMARYDLKYVWLDKKTEE